MTKAHMHAVPSWQEDLIGAQLPVATEVIVQVRNWDQEALGRIRRCLGPMSDEAWATVLLLGAMVPDTAHMGELLAWVDDEHPGDRNKKECCRCGRSKPFGDFSRDQYKADGLRPSCRACDAARYAASRRAAA
jgi:hypothetical protein